jgi:uncharacterized membrane protein YeaQ/YmgE (transglycosylase-associated protein family)
VENLTGLIVNLVVGAVGGNLGGMMAKEKTLGPLLNTVLGVVGGGIGTVISNGAGIQQATGMVGSGAVSIVLGIAIPYVISIFKKKAA